MTYIYIRKIVLSNIYIITNQSENFVEFVPYYFWNGQAF